MLNFKEELKNYQPLMELEDIETSLHSSQMQDLLDILQHIATQNGNDGFSTQPPEY